VMYDGSPPLDGWQAPAAATDLSLAELRARSSSWNGQSRR
jgi:hypothetical protein